MNYPFWDTGLGYGVLMALISVVHVFISQFAIGGGLYLVVTEHVARRRGDTAVLAWLQDLTRVFVLVTLVAGALTGVGIWFIIGLLNPGATEVLIHNFVWGWATEWTFFVVEIAAAIVYWYGWKRLPAKTHLAVGWIYFAAAWLSLFVINGIITFMLTPGAWLETGSFWDGFFNPTSWPSLVFRTGITLLLAGLYTLLVAAARPKDDTRRRLVRWNAAWSLAGLAIIAPAAVWYWHAIPAADAADAVARMTTTADAFTAAVVLVGVLAAAVLLFGIAFPRRLGVGVAVGVMALGLVWLGSFEWFRESVRKPYVITGYMYGNGLEVAKEAEYREKGYLAQMKFRTGDDGGDLFRHACRSCHTVDGYHPLKPAIDGTDPAFVAALVRGVGVMKGHMPPFMGTEAESKKLADHLWAKADHRPLAELHGERGVALGRRVYRVRCGTCHELGGYDDKTESLAGMSASDLNDLLDMAGEMAEEMPAFTASDQDREALVAFLQTLGAEGGAK